MYKTLVVIDKLNLGGVTSSLLNFLMYTSRNQEIDLLVFNNADLGIRVPKGVNILKAPSFMRLFGLSQVDTKNESRVLSFVRAILVLCSKLFGGHNVRRIVFSCFRKLSYDIAISYTHDVSWTSLTTGCNDYVHYGIKAKQKICYVHCDFQLYGGYHPKMIKNYKGFNTIVCVSRGCRNSFLSCFPGLDDRTIVCENFINIDNVKRFSEPCIPYKNCTWRFVTVCRIDEEKGVFRLIDIALKLVNQGYRDFVWRIVGDGPDYEKLKRMVSRNDLVDYVELVGKQDPPYAYIKGATLFVLPSYHEAAPMVFGECRVLKVPVLSTRTTSADELIAERDLGVVCSNETEAIYDSIVKIIEGEIILPEINEIKANTTNDYAELYYNALQKRVLESLENNE